MGAKILAAAVAAALAGSLLSACTGSNAVDQSGGSYRFVSGNKLGSMIAPGHRKKVGTVTGNLLDGGTFNLACDLGKVTVINFWATWCGPCTTETPQFDSVYRQYKNQGVTFVGIDTKESGRDAPRAFVRDNKISYPIVFDENGETAIELGKIPSQSLPFTVVLDKLGRVAGVYLGKLEPKDLTPVLTKLIAET
jgi:thiol-disulfide isomerase/thioredoxin